MLTDHMGIHQRYRDAQKEENRFNKTSLLSKPCVSSRIKQATRNNTAELKPTNAIYAYEKKAVPKLLKLIRRKAFPSVFSYNYGLLKLGR